MFSALGSRRCSYDNIRERFQLVNCYNIVCQRIFVLVAFLRCIDLPKLDVSLVNIPAKYIGHLAGIMLVPNTIAEPPFYFCLGEHLLTVSKLFFLLGHELLQFYPEFLLSVLIEGLELLVSSYFFKGLV